MYCIKCGKEIVEGANFCSNCGTEVGSNNQPKQDQTPLSNNELDKILYNFIGEYTEKYRSRKMGMRAQDYVKNFNSLTAYRFTFLLLPVVILTFIYGPLGIIMGLLVGLIPYVFICGRLLHKENTSVMTHNFKNTSDAFDYIHRLATDIIGIVPEYYNEDEVVIRFNNQTFHTITFDFTNGTYTVSCNRCTKKQVIKSGFQHSTSVMFRNAVKLNPIVKAHFKYLAIKGV